MSCFEKQPNEITIKQYKLFYSRYGEKHIEICNSLEEILDSACGNHEFGSAFNIKITDKDNNILYDHEKLMEYYGNRAKIEDGE